MPFGRLFRTNKVDAVTRIKVIPSSYSNSKRDKSSKPRTFFERKERKERGKKAKKSRCHALAQVIVPLGSVVTWLSSVFKAVREAKVFSGRRKRFTTKLQKINLEPSPEFERRKPAKSNLIPEGPDDEVQLPFESETRPNFPASFNHGPPVRAPGFGQVESRISTGNTVARFSKRHQRQLLQHEKSEIATENSRNSPEGGRTIPENSAATPEEKSTMIPRLKLEKLNDYSPVQSPKHNHENEYENKGWTPSWCSSARDGFSFQTSTPEASCTPSPRVTNSPNQYSVREQEKKPLLKELQLVHTARVEVACAMLGAMQQIDKEDHEANETMARKIVIGLICNTFGLLEAKKIEKSHCEEEFSQDTTPAESILWRKRTKGKSKQLTNRVLFNERRNDYKYYVIGDAPKEMFWGVPSPLLMSSPECETEFEPESQEDHNPASLPAAKSNFDLHPGDKHFPERCLDSSPPALVTKPEDHVSPLPQISEEDYDKLEENIFKGFGCHNLFKKF